MNIHHRNFLILAITGITIMAITVCMIVAECKTEQQEETSLIIYDDSYITDTTGFDFGQITADEIDASIIKWDDEKKMFYTKTEQETATEYERGFKNALESLALLALELDLKNERKTYSEMFDILYERNQIKE